MRNWRATLVLAALDFACLVDMKLFDYTLNSISPLAITLVIGILVDYTIVEIENIEIHLHQGKRPFQAVLHASDAIGFTISYSSEINKGEVFNRLPPTKCARFRKRNLKTNCEKRRNNLRTCRLLSVTKWRYGMYRFC
ncbi:TPA: efflux RND transporter permease subunit [Pasteurella multocida]|nr:efflux RND transporter permease subunit [Pasteurella multocida]